MGRGFILILNTSIIVLSFYSEDTLHSYCFKFLYQTKTIDLDITIYKTTN